MTVSLAPIPHGIPLEERELHVWIADLDPARLDFDVLHEGPLDAQELARARRFAHERDGLRWARSRALLRLLLGAYLRIDPASLRFQLGTHGKPRLADEQAQLSFNLSHSGAIALYAVSLGLEVGIDVEMPRRRAQTLAVAERAFGGTVATRLAQLDRPERERQFLRLWVRHEARLKCLGVGLGVTDEWTANRECRTVDFEVRDGAAAVATSGLSELCFRGWLT